MKLRKCVSVKLKQRIIYHISNNKSYTNEWKKDDKKIILALAANYGNLGDVAITYAQRNFLEKNFKNYRVLEVPINKTYTNMKSLKKIVNKNDIITIIGGGNFGNIYSDIEDARQFFIKKFPRNKIICFPQTIDFSDDKKGKQKLKKAINIYGKHKNLILFAREEKSFKIMKEHFTRNKVYLVPDIVLSLNKQEPRYARKDITICFRDDKENGIRDKGKLIEKIKQQHEGNIVMKDTHIGDVKINTEEREKYLEDIWTAFRKSKLVYTDRLHGMIFCAITGTPCIAFPNSNGKIQATYNKWLKDIPYIKVIEKVENIENIDSMGIDKIQDINVIPKSDEYKQLITEIKEF